jgi:hypothetical protein
MGTRTIGKVSLAISFSVMIVLFQNCETFEVVQGQPPINDELPNDPSGLVPVDPIVADPEKWTFIEIDGAKCADGSATGIGVNLVPGSKEFFIYMQGGGACTSADNCWGDGPGGSVNLNGYDAESFTNDGFKETYPLFDRTQGTTNPFAKMNMIMIPYCTGDAHSGNLVQDFEFPEGSGQNVKTHFVGAKNVELALKKIAVSYPSVDIVWLLGTSAGGGGANFNYKLFRSELKSRVNLIVDSTPGFYDEGDELKWEIWGSIAPCETCLTVADTRRFNRQLDPDSKYAFISFAFDKTTANGRSPQQFASELQTLVAEVQTDSKARTYIFDNSSTMFRTTLHVVTTKQESVLVEDVRAFLTAMVKGTSWENSTFLVP